LDPGGFQAGNVLGQRLNLGPNPTNLVQVGAVNLNRYFGRHPAEHVADAVGQRATHGAEGARNSPHFLADVLHDYLARTSAWSEVDVKFHGGNRYDVVA